MRWLLAGKAVTVTRVKFRIVASTILGTARSPLS